MSLVASFNGGPPDSASFAAMGVAIVAAISFGYWSGSIVMGLLGGGFAGGLVCWTLLTAFGGFLGAEIVLLVFAVGGALFGGLAGAASRWRRALKRRRESRPGDLGETGQVARPHGK
jgi:hypothetical protein